LVLDVKVESCASASEYGAEQDDEQEWEGDRPENVASAAVPAFEVANDYG
jgi:hypothetical protein